MVDFSAEAGAKALKGETVLGTASTENPLSPVGLAEAGTMRNRPEKCTVFQPIAGKIPSPMTLFFEIFFTLRAGLPRGRR